jgi:hypothetical protein
MFSYIIPSSIVIGATYLFYNSKNKNDDKPVDKKKVELLKKKFNIKSTEITQKNKSTYNSNTKLNNENNDSITIYNNNENNENNKNNKTNKKIIPPSIDIIPMPNNCLSSNIQIESVPAKLIKKLQSNIDIKDFNIYNIVSAFLNSKIIFDKLFVDNSGDKIISSIDTFISNYKNIVTNDFNGYNILLKLSDDFSSEKYIYMKKNTLIKITKQDDYKLLNNIMLKEKIFLLCEKNKFFVCMGDIFTSNINKNQIKNIFFNKLDITDPKIASNYELFCKYNKISIIYWISTKISNENNN